MPRLPIQVPQRSMELVFWYHPSVVGPAYPPEYNEPVEQQFLRLGARWFVPSVAGNVRVNTLVDGSGWFSGFPLQYIAAIPHQSKYNV